MRILGIDPGIGTTGWSVLDHQTGPAQLVAAGTIRTSTTDTHPNRLATLRREFSLLLTTYQPHQLSVERLFFAKNITTAMKVSEARGVILATGAELGIEVYEYTPLQVKQSITGYGKATKRQVNDMLRHHLPGATIPTQDDAADAIAIGLTHMTQLVTSSQSYSTQ